MEVNNPSEILKDNAATRVVPVSRFFTLFRSMRGFVRAIASQIEKKEQWKPKSEPSFFTGENFSE